MGTAIVVMEVIEFIAWTASMILFIKKIREVRKWIK